MAPSYSPVTPHPAPLPKLRSDHVQHFAGQPQFLRGTGDYLICAMKKAPWWRKYIIIHPEKSQYLSEKGQPGPSRLLGEENTVSCTVRAHHGGFRPGEDTAGVPSLWVHYTSRRFTFWFTKGKKIPKVNLNFSVLEQKVNLRSVLERHQPDEWSIPTRDLLSGLPKEGKNS